MDGSWLLKSKDSCLTLDDNLVFNEASRKKLKIKVNSIAVSGYIKSSVEDLAYSMELSGVTVDAKMDGNKFTSQFDPTQLKKGLIRLYPRADNELVFFTPTYVEVKNDGKCLKP